MERAQSLTVLQSYNMTDVGEPKIRLFVFSIGTNKLAFGGLHIII